MFLVLLLLNEPTWNLNPLNTYLVVSILSNIAKKYGTAIILTMEKPRSDVFPFLERVLYLSLGDVVYTGGTREMLQYFNDISFPCPKLENPLMYYLCLSTVDRRSRERFIESNRQIAILVEQYKKERGSLNSTLNERQVADYNIKFPVLLGKQSDYLQTGWTICINVKDTSHLITRNGLIINSLMGTYFLGIINCAILYPIYRTKYYQDAQDGLYGSTLFLITYNVISLSISFISFIIASTILYP
ncbi:unnamed protein product [Brassicogethes aeneus]|uniref:Uncharacterized protein n=1 Tax=Brassicogethes aeneus TaxID=1431903 RepID=A0A9P0B567_BRAAE|nr:unnamed protein product [Brassicogethes aeneus]